MGNGAARVALNEWRRLEDDLRTLIASGFEFPIVSYEPQVVDEKATVTLPPDADKKHSVSGGTKPLVSLNADFASAEAPTGGRSGARAKRDATSGSQSPHHVSGVAKPLASSKVETTRGTLPAGSEGKSGAKHDEATSSVSQSVHYLSADISPLAGSNAEPKSLVAPVTSDSGVGTKHDEATSSVSHSVPHISSGSKPLATKASTSGVDPVTGSNGSAAKRDAAASGSQSNHHFSASTEQLASVEVEPTSGTFATSSNSEVNAKHDVSTGSGTPLVHLVDKKQLVIMEVDYTGAGAKHDAETGVEPSLVHHVSCGTKQLANVEVELTSNSKDATIGSGLPSVSFTLMSRYNREELYSEVWSQPVHKLAKQYKLSDVGLAKVCRKLFIPLPGLGYWNKKSAGKAVPEQPSLPDVETSPKREKKLKQDRPPTRSKSSQIGNSTRPKAPHDTDVTTGNEQPAKRRQPAMVNLVCDKCGKEFQRRKGNEPAARGFSKAYCCRSHASMSQLGTAVLVHGSRNAYTHLKCRCDLCRAGNTEYMKGLYARRAMAQRAAKPDGEA